MNPDQVDEFAYSGHFYSMFLLPLLTRAKTVVETGLGGGNSARVWLAALERLPNPEQRVLYTFEMKPQQQVVDQLRSLNYRARWNLVVVDDRTPEAASMLPQGTKIDVLYLDAGHDRHEVDAELRNFGPMVVDTGVVITDDAFVRNPDRPTATYDAVKAWADAKGWSTLLFSREQGQALCFKP